MPSAELALVASVAKLLNEELGTEATIAAVAETLRRGLPAEGVTIWHREHGTPAFRSVEAPPTPDGPAPVRSLDLVSLRAGWRRYVLEHEGVRLGLLEARLGDAVAEAGVLPIVADFLAPYLAAVELSADLAGEVAAQSREIEEHRRFTSLIVDSLPVGLYVVDRTTASRAGTGSARPARRGFGATRWWDGPSSMSSRGSRRRSCARSSTGCSRPARSSRRSRR